MQLKGYAKPLIKKMRAVTMMLVKEGHCVEELQKQHDLNKI